MGEIDCASSISTYPLALLWAKHLWWYNLGYFCFWGNQHWTSHSVINWGDPIALGAWEEGVAGKDERHRRAISCFGETHYIYKTILRIAPIQNWAVHHALETQMWLRKAKKLSSRDRQGAYFWDKVKNAIKEVHIRHNRNIEERVTNPACEYCGGPHVGGGMELGLRKWIWGMNQEKEHMPKFIISRRIWWIISVGNNQAHSRGENIWITRARVRERRGPSSLKYQLFDLRYIISFLQASVFSWVKWG